MLVIRVRVGHESCGRVEFEREEVAVHVWFESRSANEVGEAESILSVSILRR
jgi:hypothetical protein